LFDDNAISGLKSALGLRRRIELAIHVCSFAISFFDGYPAFFPQKAKFSKQLSSVG
jgi:hypothetical protein